MYGSKYILEGTAIVNSGALIVPTIFEEKSFGSIFDLERDTSFQKEMRDLLLKVIAAGLIVSFRNEVDYIRLWFSRDRFKDRMKDVVPIDLSSKVYC